MIISHLLINYIFMDYRFQGVYYCFEVFVEEYQISFQREDEKGNIILESNYLIDPE